MSLNLADRKPTQNLLPPRLVIYGPPKIGKTSLAASIPDNILLDYEGGSGFTKVSRVEKGELDSYDKTISALTQLCNDKHSFQCVTIDTVDWMQSYVGEEAAKEYSTHDKTYSTAEEVPYGAGTVTMQNIFKTQILDALDYLRMEKNMMIILLAHECIRRYDNPTTQSYDRYTLKLQENTKGIGVCSLIKEWADAILFANLETFVNLEQIGQDKNKKLKKAKTSQNIILHTQESPAFLAGNRYGFPATLPFSWQAIEQALANAFNQKAA
jgi:GTPase SAR1 family protein